MHLLLKFDPPGNTFKLTRVGVCIASSVLANVLYETYNFTDIPFDDSFFGGNTATGQTDTATLSGDVSAKRAKAQRSASQKGWPSKR